MPKRKSSPSTQRTRGTGAQTKKKKKAASRKAPARRSKASASKTAIDLDSDVIPDLLEFESQSNKRAVIKVIGVGGAGGNVVNTMIASELGGVEFIAGNTDAQLFHTTKPVEDPARN